MRRYVVPILKGKWVIKLHDYISCWVQIYFTPILFNFSKLLVWSGFIHLLLHISNTQEGLPCGKGRGLSSNEKQKHTSTVTENRNISSWDQSPWFTLLSETTSIPTFSFGISVGKVWHIREVGGGTIFRL